MRTSRRLLPATLMLPRRPDEPILPTLLRPVVPSRLPILAAMRFVSRWMERLWSDAEAAYRAEILAALDSQPSTRLLDVGCDDGAWTDIVRRKLVLEPEQVSGLEFVAERAEQARARGFDVRVGDLDESWPFEDRSFDLVHANQVIEHVVRLDHFAAEMARVLRPNGRAIVCTENLASWYNVAALVLGHQPFSLTNVTACGPIGNPLALHTDPPSAPESWQHVHVLSLEALRDLFVAHGFGIEGVWAAGYHPLPGRLASRLAGADPRHAHFVGVVAKRPQTLITAAAALYVLLPFDVIPDFIPIVGHFDDAIVVTLVLASVRQRWFDKLCRLLRRVRPKAQPQPT